MVCSYWINIKLCDYCWSENVCPTGWHVPTDGEWTVLTDYLGGISVAGSKMKEVSTTSWSTDNTEATNTSLFTGLPGGVRGNLDYFNFIGENGLWWSSTEFNTSNAWCRGLGYNYVGVNSSHYNKFGGLSVRCLKD